MWNRTENKINITFIRHGLTAANEESRYLGWTDEGLSENGACAIETIWQNKPSAEIVFCSPMKRCIETANIIFKEKRLIVIPEWKEINFGRFEGKNYKELAKDKEYQAWIDSGGRIAFPEGESREEFIERTMKGFDKCIEICKEKGVSDIACVVHGGTVMAIVSSITKEDYFKFQIKTGEAYRISLPLEDLN